MEKSFKVLLPMMPNYVRFEKPPGLKQDGIKSEEAFDIANFTFEEAEEFAALMFQAFMEHWEKRRSKLNHNG